MAYATPKWGDSNVVVIYSWDANGNPVPLTTGGIMPTYVAGTNGAGYNGILRPVLTGAGSTSDAIQGITDSTGFKQLTFKIAGITVAYAEAVIIGFSLTANDIATCKSSADSQATRYGQPDGTIASNVMTLPIIVGASNVLTMDPTGDATAGRIKSVFMCQTGNSIIPGVRVLVEGIR